LLLKSRVILAFDVMKTEGLEKIYSERPTPSHYFMQVLKYGLSPICVKQLVYLFAYYVINHVKGLHLAHIGKGTRIRPTVFLRDAERIYFGEGCTINHNNVLWAGKKNAVIRIGNHVMTGPNVQMFAFNHGMEIVDLPMVEQPFTESDIIVEDDVWIGAGCILLAGAKLGKGVVLAAGSVVTKELPPYTICGGVPARVIKPRQ